MGVVGHSTGLIHNCREGGLEGKDIYRRGKGEEPGCSLKNSRAIRISFRNQYLGYSDALQRPITVSPLSVDTQIMAASASLFFMYMP